MKAILVVEMPECCYDCDFCRFNGGYMYGYYGRNCLITGECVQNNHFDITTSRHETCPFKPMPKCRYHRGNERDFTDGFNTCLKEITGETE